MRYRAISSPRSLGLLLTALVALVLVLPGCTRSDDPAHYVKMLGTDNDDVQRRGIEELARMQKKALPELQKALSSSDANTREGSLKVLARIRHSEALLAAGTKIDDPEKDVRVAAIDAVSKLSQVWKTKAVELLTRALEQDDPDCVSLAAIGLRDMRYDDATDVLEQKFAAGEGIQACYAAKLLYEAQARPEIAEFLLNGLTASVPAVRTAAQTNIKALKDLAVPFLVDTIVQGGTAAGQSPVVLREVRDALIEELDTTLDSKRAEKILHALGLVADQESIDKLIADFADKRLEKVWRVSAAEGLAVAAQSPRAGGQRRRDIIDELSETMDNEKADNRVRIGAAISLCQLREKNGVDYLVKQLDTFQEMVGGEKKVSDAEARDLTRLRISAQEALTTSGDFVVPYLIASVSKPRIVEDKDGNRMLKEAGPIVIWAAAKTFGELNVQDGVALLGRFVTEKAPATVTVKGEEDRQPRIRVAADGALSAADGTSSAEVTLKDYQNPTEAEVAAWQVRLEEFKQPDYVRWTAAIALGRIGGSEAVAFLREAEAGEKDFIERLRRNGERPDFYKRSVVINDLMRQHEDVLFYIRKALKSAGA